MKRNLFWFAILISVVLCAVKPSWAEPHEKLAALLGEIDGWDASPPQGMSLSSAAMKMINATRTYQQGDKKLIVNLLVNSGPVQEGDLRELSRENEDYRSLTRQAEGFWVNTTHFKKKDTGQLLVYLAYNQQANSILMGSYSNMAEDEAFQAVAALNLQKIRDVVAPML